MVSKNPTEKNAAIPQKLLGYNHYGARVAGGGRELGGEDRAARYSSQIVGCSSTHLMDCNHRLGGIESDTCIATVCVIWAGGE